jgi:O-antigen ligase
MVLFVVYFGLGVAAYFINPPAHNSLDSIGTTIHFLLFVPMLMVLHKYPAKASWVWIAIILGSCLNGLHALYFNSRGTINPILFGDISVYLAFGSLVSLSYMRQYKFGVILSLVGFALGLIAAFYSLSRGSWLAVGPLIVVVLYYLYKSMESKKRLVVPLIILSAIVVGSVLAGWSKIQPRIDLAFAELNTYFQGEEYRTSVGYRLETYKGALLTIKENPVFGVGPGNRAEYFNDLESRGLLRDLDYILNAHNQIFEDGIDKGLLGIVSYLVLMIYLFMTFFKFKGQYESSRVYDPLNVAGVMLVIGYAVFGLTNITFTHGTFNTFFVCMVVLLLVTRSQPPSKPSDV